MVGRVPIPTMLNRSWTRTERLLAGYYWIKKVKTNSCCSQLCFRLHSSASFLKISLRYSLQSGPLCRTLGRINYGIEKLDQLTYALPIFRAVGLNFWTSGWLFGRLALLLS